MCGHDVLWFFQPRALVRPSPLPSQRLLVFLCSLLCQLFQAFKVLFENVTLLHHSRMAPFVACYHAHLQLCFAVFPCYLPLSSSEFSLNDYPIWLFCHSLFSNKKMEASGMNINLTVYPIVPNLFVITFSFSEVN